MQLILLMLLAAASPAATYNFYFNNTEQGANSSAAPSLNVGVKDPIKEKSSDTLSGAEAQNPSEPLAPVTAPEALTAEAGNPSTTETLFPNAKWKASLGLSSGTYNWGRAFNPLPRSGYTGRVSVQGSLTYYLAPELGISAMIGRLSGLEVEIAPLGVRTGWGKLQLGFTAGVLKDTKGLLLYNEGETSGGPWEAAMSDQWKDQIDVDVKQAKPVNFYAGAHLGLNIIRDVAAVASYRISPVAKYGQTLATSSLTLNYLF